MQSGKEREEVQKVEIGDLLQLFFFCLSGGHCSTRNILLWHAVRNSHKRRSHAADQEEGGKREGRERGTRNEVVQTSEQQKERRERDARAMAFADFPCQEEKEFKSDDCDSSLRSLSFSHSFMDDDERMLCIMHHDDVSLTEAEEEDEKKVTIA